MDQARRSSMRHAHGCVIVLRGQIIGQGYNSYSMRHGHKWSEHAEVAACKSLPSFEHLRGAHLYIVRLQRNSGEAVLSRPCHGCSLFLQFMMRRYGLAHVFYSL